MKYFFFVSFYNGKMADFSFKDSVNNSNIHNNSVILVKCWTDWGQGKHSQPSHLKHAQAYGYSRIENVSLGLLKTGTSECDLIYP